MTNSPMVVPAGLQRRADAEIIQDRAQAWSNNARHLPAGDSLRAAYRSDAADLRKVASTLRTKGYKAAFALANSLDSIVRDQIPTGVWRRMSRLA